MKLDPRIKQGCRPFTMFDTDAAKEFIGKQGFFTNDITAFHDFNYNCNKIAYGILKTINDIGIYPFYTNGRELFNFFIPAEFADIKVLEIKFKEIKWTSKQS